MSKQQLLTWVEVDASALRHNVQQFKKHIGTSTRLAVVVKSNAYGHDLIMTSRVFVEAGADWLCVHSLAEAQVLRDAGITIPILIIGYVLFSDLEKVAKLDCRMVVYNQETIDQLGKIGAPVKVHIKIETGTHRQGVLLHDLAQFVGKIQQYPNIEIEGASTHFANIEDTINDDYYQQQLAQFKKGIQIIEEQGVSLQMKHCASTAATLLFPESHMDMVRVGVSAYGMWPSEKNKASYHTDHVDEVSSLLQPAFTWKSRIAQIKTITEGEFIGYGCTYKTTRETMMAVIPVGYYDGYVRAVDGKAHVLVHGQRAALLGRVSMNNIVVDITDIEDVALEDEVVLLGMQGEEEISAEQFADWCDTINYEITTRVSAGVNSNIPRILINA